MSNLKEVRKFAPAAASHSDTLFSACNLCTLKSILVAPK